MLVLSPQEKLAYADNGFLVLPDFISKDVCTMLMERAKQLITDFLPINEKTVFSSAKQTHTKHDYFFASSEKIHFFYEAKALDADGNFLTDKHLSINKIGHALHDVDSIFNTFSRMHKIAALTEDLSFANPLLLQSMYICKQPFIGDEVNCHQDNTYLFTEKEPVMGLWFALEDATLENGCLWALPGGHKEGLKSKYFRNTHNEMVTEVYDASPWDQSRLVPLEVKQGSCVVLHGLVPHMSKMNHSNKSRHAYSLHLISGNDHYPKTNWLQRSEKLPLRGFI